MKEPTLREYADEMVAEPRQVKDDHVPTANELNNLMYLFMGRFGLGMRVVDLATVNMMATVGGNSIKSLQDLDRFIDEMAGYVWDHCMGEPDSITVEDMVYLGHKIKDVLYGMDEKTRNDIEPKPLKSESECGCGHDHD